MICRQGRNDSLIYKGYSCHSGFSTSLFRERGKRHIHTFITTPAAVVDPPDRSINLPSSLQSWYSSIQTGLNISSWITAVQFLLRHLDMDRDKNITTAWEIHIYLHKTTHLGLLLITSPDPLWSTDISFVTVAGSLTDR